MRSETLWSDRHRARLFLVPDGEHLPAGDFVLRTLTGRELSVDEAGVAPFEVSEEEAREWLKSEFGQLLDAVRAGIDRFTERLRQGPGGAAAGEADKP